MRSDPLFTYAVIADTHMNQEENYSSSPYPCNALANARTRYVIAELNRLKPDFVVHLGDIVNPVPELPTYTDAANHFKNLVKALDAPLHLVPGNHDIGDKPVSWMPAGTVTEEHIALYESHFGKHYYSFDHKGLHVVIVNTPLINSGLDAEREQQAWLEDDLKENAGRRIVLCVHYPPYVSNPDENGSYDNIDEPGRSWLLGLIRQHRVEVIFCGHVHNFWYDRLADSEMYLLPSTAFVRHDYSEFYRIEPGDQYGRNDEPKLGYCVVRVYENEQIVETIRTYGRTLDEAQALAPEVKSVRPVLSRESTIDSVGVDMRHPWAEELEIAPSGAVDEFERKIARNDYPVLALWEMGLRRMRVPIQDVANPKTRKRMQALKRIGHTFQVFCYGLPNDALLSSLADASGLVDILEVVLPWDKTPGAMEELRSIKAKTGVRLYLSRVNRKDAAKVAGARFNHLISHGFVLAERADLADFTNTHDPDGVLDGFVFRIPNDASPADAVIEARDLTESLDRDACLYIRTSAASPAEAYIDDEENAARIAESVVSCIGGGPRISAVLDTFADIDRGYFARTGLVDRRYNPRLSSHVVKNLIGLFQEGGWLLEERHTEAGAATITVILRNRQGDYARLVVNGAEDNLQSGKQGEIIDLATGSVLAFDAGMQVPRLCMVIERQETARLAKTGTE